MGVSSHSIKEPAFAKLGKIGYEGARNQLKDTPGVSPFHRQELSKDKVEFTCGLPGLAWPENKMAKKLLRIASMKIGPEAASPPCRLYSKFTLFSDELISKGSSSWWTPRSRRDTSVPSSPNKAVYDQYISPHHSAKDPLPSSRPPASLPPLPRQATIATPTLKSTVLSKIVSYQETTSG